MRSFVLILLLLPVLACAQFKVLTRTIPAGGEDTSIRIANYYPVWMQRPFGVSGYGCPPESLYSILPAHDFIVHFDNSNVNSSAPYCAYVGTLARKNDLFYSATSYPGGWPSDTVFYKDSLRAITQRNGVKLLVGMIDVPGTSLNAVSADSANTDSLAHEFVKFAYDYGYDGIDIDWENLSATAANATRLVRLTRKWLNYYYGWSSNKLNRAYLTLSASRYHASTYLPSEDSSVTCFILQLYDFPNVWGGSCNVVWYNSPLVRGAAPPVIGECSAWDQGGPTAGAPGMVNFENAGHDTSVIGGLLPAYGVAYLKGDTALFSCVNTFQTQILWPTLSTYVTRGGEVRWDDVRKVPYIAGVANASGWNAPGYYTISMSSGQHMRVSYEDSLSTVLKVQYFIDNGYKWLGFYDLQADFSSSYAAYNGRFRMTEWVMEYLGRQ